MTKWKIQLCRWILGSILPAYCDHYKLFDSYNFFLCWIFFFALII